MKRRNILQNARKFSRITLATTATLAFGIGIVIILQFLFEGNSAELAKANNLNFSLSEEGSAAQDLLPIRRSTAEAYAMAKRSGHFVCMIKHGDERFGICDEGGNKEFFAFGQREEMDVCQRLQDDSDWGEPDWNAKFRFVGPNGEVCNSDSKDPGKCDDEIDSWDFGQCAKCGQFWSPIDGKMVSPIEAVWGESDVTVKVYAINYWPYTKTENDGNKVTVRMDRSNLDFKVDIIDVTTGTTLSSQVYEGNSSAISCYTEKQMREQTPLHWNAWENAPRENNKVMCTLNPVKYSGLTFLPGHTYKVEAYTKITHEATDKKNLGWQTADLCTAIKMIPNEPKLSCVNKNANKTSVVPGGQIEYTVNLKIENESFDKVTFVDDFDETKVEVVKFPDEMPGQENWGCYKNTIDTLRAIRCETKTAVAPGDYQVKYILKALGNSTGNIANKVTTIEGMRNGTKYTGDTSACVANVNTIEPNVVCDSKTINRSDVAIGDTATFVLTYSNSTAATAKNIFVKEQHLGSSYSAPRNFRVRSGSSGAWTILSGEICNEDLLTAPDAPGCLIATELAGNSNAQLAFDVNIVNLQDLEERAFFKYQNDKQTNICPFTPPTPVEPTIACDEKRIETEIPEGVRIGDTVTFHIDYSNTSRASESTIFIRESVGELLGTSYTDVRNVRVDGSPYADCDVNKLLRDGCSVPGLKGGASATFSFDATVSNLDDLRNRAIIRYGDHGTETDPNVCSITPAAIHPVAACSYKKAFDYKGVEINDESDIKTGDYVTYEISYTSGNEPGEVYISDTLATNLEFAGFDEISESYCNYDESPRLISCTVPGNVQGSVRFDVRILESGEIANTATVYDDYNSNNTCLVNFNARPLIDKLVCQSKESGSQHVDIGDEVTFTITYKNEGESVLNGIDLIDELPVGMRLVSSVDNACGVVQEYEAGGEMIACHSDETLDPGSIATFTLTVEISEDAPVGEGITNIVTLLASGDVMGETTECREDIYINLPEPSVTVEKETKSPADRDMYLGDDAETPEDHVRFKIVITNDGPTKLVVVPLDDSFDPDDFEFISAEPMPDVVETGYLHWNDLGDLVEGESLTVYVTLKALESDHDRLYNVTQVEDAIDENEVHTDSNIDHDYVDILEVLAEILQVNIQKDLISEDPAKVGTTVKFHITITNTGEKVIGSIKFIDTYDNTYLSIVDYSEHISHDAKLYTVNEAQGIFTHNNLLAGRDALNPDDKLEFDIWFTSLKSGDTLNHAKVIVEDKSDEDDASVKIIAVLADTGQNVLPFILIGSSLIVLLCARKKVWSK